VTAAPFRPHADAPCGRCPFRRDSAAGWLGEAPPEEFVQLIQIEYPLPCHATLDYEDPRWRERWEAGEVGSLCRGALVMAANMRKLARNQSAQPRVPADCEAVFATPAEFVAHHRSSPVRSWEDEQ
jgi:hypothetical protein